MTHLTSRSLYTRPAYLVAETEARLKNTAIKMRIFKVLCLAVKHQQHGIGICSVFRSGWANSQRHKLQLFKTYSTTNIYPTQWQNCFRFSPSSTITPNLLMKYSGTTVQSRLLTESSDLSNKEFNNTDSKGPKSVAAFLTKLSELVPRSVLKQMTLLIKLLDSEVSSHFCA